MKILHLDPDDIDNPLSGGGPVRTYEIYRRLASHHEVTVLTPTFPGSTPERTRDGIRYLRLGRRIRDHGSSHHLTFLASLPGAVRRHSYDLLVEDTMPPCSATWTPWFRRRSAPMVASVQWWFARDYTRRLKLPFHWGESHGIRAYSHFVVLSESMRAQILSSHPGADCRVIPNGVDPTLFDLPLQAGRDVLYLGRIECHAKGLDLLLQAWAALPVAERPMLWVAGSANAPEQQRFDRLLGETGMGPWVRCVGKVDATGRADLLRRCRFTVMPSRFETFGMTIAEANAAGKPALVFDMAPMNEVAAPIDLRVTAFDVAVYAQAIRHLLRLTDDEIVARGAACRRSARRYDWDTLAAAQEAFYLQLAAVHR